ncbi:hypothetical protein [Kitasatospora sp. NPDC059673]
MIDVQAAGGTFPITGTGWPTRDGSGIRDSLRWREVRDGVIGDD